MPRTAAKASLPSCSNSTIAPVRASHVINIVGFSRTFNDHLVSPRFESCSFRSGGQTWKIACYPKGSYPENIDFISLHLFLVDAIDGSVTVEATFNLLDQDLKPVPSYSRTAVTTFSAPAGRGIERFIKRKELEESKHLKDDCFAVRVDVHIVNKVAMPPSDMHQHLGDLLSTKEHTDIEFQVNGEIIAAHRLLLGAQLSVFLQSIKEGASTNVIQIDDMEANVLRALLTFVYTDALPEMEREEEFGMSQRLLIAADRYDLQRLKLMCESRLCDHIDSSSVAAIKEIAEKHHCPTLNQACIDFLDSSTTLSLIPDP